MGDSVKTFHVGTVDELVEVEGLSDRDNQVIGEYTDILVKSGLDAAMKYLNTLSEPPSPVVQELLRVARLLHRAAHSERPSLKTPDPVSRHKTKK